MTLEAAAVSRCPDVSEIAEFVEGKLGAEAAEQLSQHLMGCDACSDIVATYAKLWSLSPRLGARGAQRYALVRQLGGGGMGEVYLAYDQRLEREVAVKTVRGGTERGRRRLVAEARHAAALADPHVVEVFEVGQMDGEAFIAMEFVDGVALSTWLAQPRGLREIVDVFLQAGRGLAAAHEVGIAHRDFKPSNVLVSPDGRAKVTDFGLACLIEDRQTAAEGGGTPAYAAPEQLHGDATDARADQYSFCVALREAAGRTNQRRGAMAAGVRRILARGLQTDPDDRFPSMSALLAVLKSARDAGRVRLIAIVVLSVIAAPIAIGLALRTECETHEQRAASVLSSARRAAIQGAFAATDRPHAAATLVRVESELGERVAQWAAADAALCQQRRDDPTRARDWDFAGGCLADRRRQLAATVDVLEHADAEVVDHAIALVHGLLSVRDCQPGAHGGGEPAPPPQLRQAVEAIQTRLAQVEALAQAGKEADAAALARPLLVEAEAVGYASLVAEVRATLGATLVRAGEHDEGLAALEQAVWEATAAGDDVTVARASLVLFAAHASYDGNVEAAQRWQQVSAAALDRVGAGPMRRAEHLRYRAGRAETIGDYAEAIDLARQALEVSEAAFGPDDRRNGPALASLGQMLFRNGRYEEAGEVLQRSVDIARRDLGPDHPTLGRRLQLSAAVAEYTQRYGDSVALARESVRILDGALGPSHVATLNARAQFGEQLASAGEAKQGLVQLEDTLRVIESSLGPDHPLVAQVSGSLGRVHVRQGELDTARVHFVRALTILRAVDGPDHPIVATTSSHLGEALRRLGELEQARAAHTEALRIRRLGATPARVAISLESLARVAEDEGKLSEAVALYEEAAQRWAEAKGEDDPNVAAARDLARRLAARAARPRR